MPIDLTHDTGAIQELATQVRRKTLMILDAAGESELTFAPPGLSNHILWHAGHALWVTDLLCLEAATGRSELPAGWADTFGMKCRPVRLTTRWPSKGQVANLLTNQLSRLLEVFASLSRNDLTGPPRSPRLSDRRSLGWSILHGLHDEANHQGEMYLLLKMQRAR